MHMPGLQPQKKRSTSFIDHYFPRYKKNKTTGADERVYTVEMPTPGFLCPSCQKCCGNAGALATHMKSQHPTSVPKLDSYLGPVKSTSMHCWEQPGSVSLMGPGEAILGCILSEQVAF